LCSAKACSSTAVIVIVCVSARRRLDEQVA
jgi:hypothetical protein